MTPLLRCCSVAALSISAVLGGLCQDGSAQGVKNPGPPLIEEDQEQILSYWTTQGGWHSELQLRNNLSAQDLTVTPVLRSNDGSETPLPAVTIKPQEVQSINLGVELTTYAPQLIDSYGSVALRYRAYANGNLYAAIMVHDTGHPIAFHIDASRESSDYDAGSREGIWWLPNDSAKDILVLTNQGKRPLTLDVSIYDSAGKEVRQQVPLGPRQTSIYSVRDLVSSGHLSGTYGGIRVQAPEHGGSLDTLHAVYDETSGFSALLKMFDRDPVAKIESRDYAHTSVWTQRAPMLALSIPDEALHFPLDTILQPQIFVRNASKRKVTAKMRFVWRTGDVTGKSAGPVIVLNPNQTQRIDVGALQNDGTIPANAHWASVILTSDGAPDEIFAVSASYDPTLRYGAQTPFSDQLASKWVGGQWAVDSMHDSLIAIGNGGTKPVSAEFTIFYNRGQNRYDLEQALQPDEQMWIDVGRLIRERIPDKNGKHLPADMESGSYSFRDLTNRAVGSLFEGKVIYDKSYGHVAYGCSACCGITSVYLTYNPFYTLLGPGYTNGVEDNDNCGDRGMDVSGDFYNWNTANHAIATTTVQGHHTGISIGGTTSSTHGNIQRENTRGFCPTVVASPTGPTDVAATPTNFQTFQVQNLTDGTIVFSYTWQSTSGSLVDIASCKVGETVFYPGTAASYVWPAPMVASTKNPTPLYVPGNNAGPNPTTAGLGDYNKPPDSYSTPYSPGSSFSATQTLQWECPDFNNGAYYRFVPDITITRKVFLDTTDNKWKYQISKSGQTNTVILPNQ